MKCDCGGVFFVVKVHDESDMTKERLCDVECIECKKTLYFQPYDFGKRINVVNKKDSTKK